MDAFNRLAWILLAAIHAPPAMATNQPPMALTTTHTVDYSTALPDSDETAHCQVEASGPKR